MPFIKNEEPDSRRERERQREGPRTAVNRRKRNRPVEFPGWLAPTTMKKR